MDLAEIARLRGLRKVALCRTFWCSLSDLLAVPLPGPSAHLPASLPYPRRSQSSPSLQKYKETHTQLPGGGVPPPSPVANAQPNVSPPTSTAAAPPPPPPVRPSPTPAPYQPIQPAQARTIERRGR